MPNLAPQSRDKFIRALERKYGCTFCREGRKHTVYVKDDVLEPIVIPRHKTISPGVIRNICKILGVSVEDMLKTLRNC